MSESMSICFAFLFGMIVAGSAIGLLCALLPGTMIAVLFTTLSPQRRTDALDILYGFFCDACGRQWKEHKDGDACRAPETENAEEQG
jgi:hypothetical protein